MQTIINLCAGRMASMKILVIGTSNSVIGRNGYIRALKREHIVEVHAIGRAPIYFHIGKILEFKNTLESYDLIIFDHMSNCSFLKNKYYLNDLNDFYKLISSINTTVVILSFPTLSQSKVLMEYKKKSKSLCRKYNIPLLDLDLLHLELDNFKDINHINTYTSYIIGSVINNNVRVLCGEISDNIPFYNKFYYVSCDDFANDISIFKNSLLAKRYKKISDYIEFTKANLEDEVVAIEYIAT